MLEIISYCWDLLTPLFSVCQSVAVDAISFHPASINTSWASPNYRTYSKTPIANLVPGLIKAS